jgi:hypothetical protein
MTVLSHKVTFVLPKFWQHLVTFRSICQAYQSILTRRKTYHISQFRRFLRTRARQQASWDGITVYCVRTALSCLQGQTGLTVEVAAEENEVCERYWEVVRSCRKVCRLSGSQWQWRPRSKHSASKRRQTCRQTITEVVCCSTI